MLRSLTQVRHVPIEACAAGGSGAADRDARGPRLDDEAPRHTRLDERAVGRRRLTEDLRDQPLRAVRLLGRAGDDEVAARLGERRQRARPRGGKGVAQRTDAEAIH